MWVQFAKLGQLLHEIGAQTLMQPEEVGIVLDKTQLLEVSNQFSSGEFKHILPVSIQPIIILRKKAWFRSWFGNLVIGFYLRTMALEYYSHLIFCQLEHCWWGKVDSGCSSNVWWNACRRTGGLAIVWQNLRRLKVIRVGVWEMLFSLGVHWNIQDTFASIGAHEKANSIIDSKSSLHDDS